MKKIFEKTIFIFFLLLPILAFVFLFGGILSKGLVGTVSAQTNYCTDAGYHECTVGTPRAEDCQKDGKTCTVYETYECNFGGKNYCGPPYEPNPQTCAEPCWPNSCPAGTTQAPASKDGQRLSDTIVGSNLLPYTGSGLCGYAYYHWDSTKSTTLKNGDACFVIVFTPWADQTKCPKTASSPSPRTSPLPSRSPGTCTVSWVQLPQNPAPNTTATVKVKGVSDPGGWQNVNYRVDGGTWSGNFSNIDVASKTFTFDINSGAAGSHKLEFSTSNKTNICTPTGDFTTGSGSSVTTVSFRVAESPTELDSAPWQNYTAAPMKLDFEFKDKTPGMKFVWVEFKDSTGKLERRSAQIRLLGGEPQILGCSLGFEGNSVVFNIAGKNFGTTQGSVTSGTGNLTIREWKDNIIKALFNNPPTGETFPIVVTSSEGQKVEGHCSAISQLALGAKVFCRAPSSHATDNVALTLAGIFPGGTLTRQKVTIDKEGLVQGLTQKLEEGKNYQLSLKAPKSLRQTTDEFTAQGGTTNIPNFILPVGDIFPADGGDGTINSLDKGELNRQWVISVDAGNRSGDFNRDARVNSIDWACMRYDFGEVDDPEPVAGRAAASPSPAGVCAQVITPAKNPATNECQDFPTPCDVPASWQKVASCN